MAFVQAEAAYSTGQVAYIHVTLPGATTAGNAVFVLGCTYHGEDVIGSSCTGTGTYVLDWPIDAGYTNRVMFSQLNIAGDVGEITFHYKSDDSLSSYLGVAAAEFSGIATSSAFVAAKSTLELGASGTAFGISTTGDTTEACLIIGGGRDGTSARTHAAAGDSILAHDIAAGGYQGGVLVYEIQAAAGAATLDWTASAADTFAEILAVYKLAAGGGTSVTKSGSITNTGAYSRKLELNRTQGGIL